MIGFTPQLCWAHWVGFDAMRYSQLALVLTCLVKSYLATERYGGPMLVHLVINVGRFGNNASPQKKHWNGARPTTNLVRCWTPLSGGRTLLKCTKTKSNVQQRTRFVVGRAFWWSVEILLIKAVLVSPSEFGGYLGLFETFDQLSPIQQHLPPKNISK